MGPSTQERSAESPAEQRVSRRVANDARRQSSDSVEQSSARLESTSSAGRNAGAIASAGAQEQPPRVHSSGYDTQARAIGGAAREWWSVGRTARARTIEGGRSREARGA